LRFLARSIPDYAVPEVCFGTVYLENVYILGKDDVGFKIKSRFLVRSIPDYAVPEAGFITVYLEDVSILCMDEVGFKTQPEVSGEVYS
jgi:hypothetical protein